MRTLLDETNSREETEMKKKTSQVPPRASLMDPRFKYVPAVNTDITQTWRRFGWVPLAEKRAEAA